LALVERGDQGGWHGRRATLGTSGFLRDFDEHLWLAAAVAQQAVDRMRPGGTLLVRGDRIFVVVKSLFVSFDRA